MIKGCIFDLDGVIVDTAKYHFVAWRKLGREFGYELTETQNEKLKGENNEKDSKLQSQANLIERLMN